MDMNILDIKIIRYRSKTKLLENILGGKWKYVGRGGFCRRWECEDGRTVRYTAAPVDEFDNTCGNPQCWLDTPGYATEPFHWNPVK